MSIKTAYEIIEDSDAKFLGSLRKFEVNQLKEMKVETLEPQGGGGSGL